MKDGHNLFEIVNANKKSVCVNYNLPDGREVIYRLVKKADVFIHNWREEAVREPRWMQKPCVVTFHLIVQSVLNISSNRDLTASQLDFLQVVILSS